MSLVLEITLTLALSRSTGRGDRRSVSTNGSYTRESRPSENEKTP